MSSLIRPATGRQAARFGRRAAARRGSVLPLFAVLLFVLLPLAALVIDLGFVTLARRQMQGAVDTAALEGLRGRAIPPAAAEVAEAARRDNARRLGGYQFQANTIDYSGGTPLPGTDFRASAQIQTSVYVPDLKLNEPNAVAGDMVLGSYDPNTADHREQGVTSGQPYQRADFTPADDSDPGANAFLVRMRRTDETFAPDDESSSAGPPVPFVFGHGGGVAGPAELWNRRARGTIVRAAAIADARPAMSVGAASAGIPGAANFYLYLNPSAAKNRRGWHEDWDGDSATPGDNDDLLTLDSPTPSGELVGASSAAPIGAFADFGGVVTVGEMPLDAGAPLALVEGLAYVPLVDDVLKPNAADAADTELRVVAFGMVRIGTSGNGTLSRAKLHVAAQNASAAFLETAHFLPSHAHPLDPAPLMAKVNEALHPIAPAVLVASPLLAPALVRSIP